MSRRRSTTYRRPTRMQRGVYVRQAKQKSPLGSALGTALAVALVLLAIVLASRGGLTTPNHTVPTKKPATHAATHVRR